MPSKDKSWEIDPPPEHLKRHKEVYDRHMAGEYLKDIAEDMNISPARAKQLFDRWQRQIIRYNRAHRS